MIRCLAKVPGISVIAGGARGPAAKSGLLWWGGSNPAIVNDDEVVDKVTPARLSAAEFVGVNCLSFDGTSCTFPAEAAPSDATGSISFWYKPDDVTLSTEQELYYARDDGGLYRARVYGTVDRIWVQIRVNGVDLLRGNAVTGLIAGQWHFITITQDGVEPVVNVDGTDYSLAYVVSTDKTAWFHSIAGNVTWVRIGTNLKGDLSQFDVHDGHWTSPFSDGYDLPQDVSGNGNHATANTATWTTTSGIPSHDHEYGHTPSVVSDGTGPSFVLDTPVNVEGGLNIEFDIKVKDGATTQYLVGTDLNIYNFIRIASISGGNTTFNTQFQTSDTPTFNYTETVMPYDILNKRVKLRFLFNPTINTMSIYVDDDLKVTSAVYSSIYVTQIENLLHRRAGTTESPIADIYGIKMWNDSGQLVDAIPIAAGKVYDKVNTAVYSDRGAGTFVTKYIPALLDGSGNDAEGNPVEWEGQNHHNNSEVSVRHTDFEVVDSILEGGDTRYVYGGVDNSRPLYQFPDPFVWSRRVRFDGAQWVWEDSLLNVLASNSSTSTFVPKTGWVLGTGTGLPVFTYDCLYIENGEFKEVSYADYLAHVSGLSNTFLRYKKAGQDNCHIEEAGLYEQGTDFTVGELLKNLRYFKTGECGSSVELVIQDGEYVTDNGYAVYI